MTDIEDPLLPIPNVPIYWFPEVSSTMDTVSQIELLNNAYTDVDLINRPEKS